MGMVIIIMIGVYIAYYLYTIKRQRQLLINSFNQAQKIIKNDVVFATIPETLKKELSNTWLLTSSTAVICRHLKENGSLWKPGWFETRNFSNYLLRQIRVNDIEIYKKIVGDTYGITFLSNSAHTLYRADSRPHSEVFSEGFKLFRRKWHFDNASKLLLPKKSTDNKTLTHQNEVRTKLQNRLPIHFSLGAAHRDDSFFDAIAQKLNEMQDESTHDVKSLRLLCDAYAKDKSKQDEWVRVAITQEDEKDFNQYLVRIQFTAQEMEENNLSFGPVIYGRGEIEGRMLCEQLGIKLHIIEVLEEEKEGCNVMEQWIDATGAHSIETLPKDKYDETDVIHLVVYRFHVVPLISGSPGIPLVGEQQVNNNVNQDPHDEEKLNETTDLRGYRNRYTGIAPTKDCGEFYYCIKLPQNHNLLFKQKISYRKKLKEVKALDDIPAQYVEKQIKHDSGAYGFFQQKKINENYDPNYRAPVPSPRGCY